MENNNDWEKRTKVGKVGLLDKGEFNPHYPGGYNCLDMVTKDGAIWTSLVAGNTDPIPADGQDTDKWKMRFRSVYEAEAARAEAEADRAEAEAKREEKEAAREAAEDKRKEQFEAAEAERKEQFEAAEAEHKAAEEQRMEQEAAREESETERKTKFAYMEEKIDGLSMLTTEDVNTIFNEQ